MHLRSVSRAGRALALMAALAVTTGMRFAGAPGDCLVEDANWMSVDGGCKDMTTGRVWSAAYSAEYHEIWPNFYEAQTICSDLVEGGYSDWRTPTLDELKAGYANGATGHINDGSPSGGKWSSTYGSKSKKTAYYFIFESGIFWATGIYDPRVGYSRHDVICVR
jgi:hypothetical protein